jgi:hypothetical protein
MEVKQARMRANETEADVTQKIADVLVSFLLAPFATSLDDHQ